MSAEARLVKQAEELVAAWKQRTFPGADIEPPDRDLIEMVADALIERDVFQRETHRLLVELLDLRTRLHEAEREWDMWKASSEEHAKAIDAQYALRMQTEQRVAALKRFIATVMSGERITPDLEKEWAALSPAPKEEQR